MNLAEARKKHEDARAKVRIRVVIVLCRQFNLFTRTVIAIDRSKFKAVNNRDKNFTVAKVGCGAVIVRTTRIAS